MASEERLNTVTYEAAGDLSGNQYYGVKLDTNGRVAVTAEGNAAIGILQDNPAALGRAACVAIGGKSKVVCGGTITAGARFCFDSAGKAVALGSGDDWSMGVLSDPAGGASGKIAECTIMPTGPHGIAGVSP